MASLEVLTKSIDLYILEGIPTGGFLEAVLSNDLQEAMGRADEESRAILFDVVYYLFNYCPSICWGSPKKHYDWLAMEPDDRLLLVAGSQFGVRRGVVFPANKEKTNDGS